VVAVVAVLEVAAAAREVTAAVRTVRMVAVVTTTTAVEVEAAMAAPTEEAEAVGRRAVRMALKVVHMALRVDRMALRVVPTVVVAAAEVSMETKEDRHTPEVEVVAEAVDPSGLAIGAAPPATRTTLHHVSSVCGVVWPSHRAIRPQLPTTPHPSPWAVRL